MIPNDFIQTLLARIDIVDVIDRHVPLKKAGANWVACCPFHSEKSPSFTVSQSKQFYHCFGCGAHGTAIGFLMEYAGKSFPDAVEELARDAGLQVPRIERPGEAERREQAADLAGFNLAAAKFYRGELKDAPAAVEYLKGRGLTGAIAARFGVGYAPDAWQPLAAVFADYADNRHLETVGLVIAGDGGKRYDRFRDRIMFPIHDSRGQVIGFGGRVLGSGEPKYLNSPETPLFSKGRELYGLYLARNGIRDAGRVVVVEGYMDVVALAQHGVDYAVATLGTATTPVHVQKLFRLTDHVVFCFDGDNAGRKAAWRALENTLPVIADGKNATFLFLPDGEDPDDFVRKRGKAAFEAAIGGATPLSEFMLSELTKAHPPTSAEGRAAFVAAAKPLYAQLGAPILAALLRRRLGDLTGLPEADLRSLLPAAGSERPAPVRDEARAGDDGGAFDHAYADSAGEAPGAFRGGSARRPAGPARRAPSLARGLIEALLLKPELAGALVGVMVDDDPPAAAALAALTAFCTESPGVTTAAIVQQFAGTPHERVLADALARCEDHGLNADQADAIVAGARAQFAARNEAAEVRQLLATPLDQLTVEQRDRLRASRRAPAKDRSGAAG
jgi:DNA primase